MFALELFSPLGSFKCEDVVYNVTNSTKKQNKKGTIFKGEVSLGISNKHVMFTIVFFFFLTLPLGSIPTVWWRSGEARPFWKT